MARHAAERPDAPALQDGRRTLTWSELQGLGRRRRGRSARARARRRRPRLDLDVEPRRGGRHVPRLLARGPRLQSLAAPHLHVRRDRHAAASGCSARALLTEPGWGADRARVDLASRRSPASPRSRRVYTPQTLPGARARTTPQPCGDPDKVAYLAFTSGTTGAPKCVMHSDNTLLANARDLVRDWGHGPRHGAAQPVAAVASHRLGGIAQWLVAGCRVRRSTIRRPARTRSTGSSRPAPPT